MSRLLNRRSALGLLISTLLVSAGKPVGACKPGHHCGGDKNGGKGHGGSGHGGDSGHGGKKKSKKQARIRACEKDGKAYERLLDGLCVAHFYYDLVFAASCAACFDVCANHLAHCRRGEAKSCTENCGTEWGIPVHLN
jgi:hypothetical protein